MIVIDASVLANALADDEENGRHARRELRAAEQIAAPDLVNVETVSVLRKRWLCGSLTEVRFRTAISDVSAHDACCVALAEHLDCELVTADARLADATGPLCHIRVLR